MKDNTNRNLANRIINKIIEDMCARRGFRQNWDAIDDDMRREIRRKWREIILNELEGETGTV